MSSRIKGRGIATIASALFAMALAAAVAGRGCHTKDDGPTDVAWAFVRASADGDRGALLKLLGPKTKARLAQYAAEATHRVGGEGRYTARDMIATTSEGPRTVSIVNMGRDGDIASLSLADKKGNKSTITAVFIDGAWLIELSE